MADSDGAQTVQTILAGASGGIAALAAVLPPPWNTAIGAVASAVALIGDLVRHGVRPEVAIETMRSSLPDYEAARDRLRDLIDRKAERP